METKIKELESPIFALCIIEKILIVAIGGGNKKFGVKNKIISFRISSSGISNKVLYTLDLENDVPVFIEPDENRKIFAVCMNNVSIIYQLDTINGEFKEIYNFKTLENYNDDLYQSVIKINQNYIATGTTSGEISLYKFDYTNNKKINVEKISQNKTDHTRKINNIIIIPEKKLLFSASSDGTAKLFEMDKLNLLNSVSFREKLEENANYFIRDIFYDQKTSYLYTLQSPFHGKSYITKWKGKKGLIPIETILVSKENCSTMKFCNYSHGLGITGCDGNIFFVDIANHMTVTKKINLGENMIKCGMFYENNFITGSTDNFLRVNSYKGKGCFSFFSFIRFLLILLFVFRAFMLSVKPDKYHFPV